MTDKDVDVKYLDHLMAIIKYVENMAKMSVRRDFGKDIGKTADELFADVQPEVVAMDELCREHGLPHIFTGDINSQEDVNQYCRAIVSEKFKNRKV